MAMVGGGAADLSAGNASADNSADGVSADNTTTDEHLMAAYIKGDAIAFDHLFERYGPRIYRMALRNLRTEHQAKDIVQKTFLRVHRARRDFRLDSRFRPWVTTIAMNLIREVWRRKKRKPETTFEHEDQLMHASAQEAGDRSAPGFNPQATPSPDLMLERQDRQLALRQAVGQLPNAQREVIELHWFQELSFRDVANIVGASEGAVRVRAHRAYSKLKELLQGDAAL